MAPLEADTHEVCPARLGLRIARGAVLQCGDDVDPGHYIEGEFPLRKVELRARVSGHLCFECAGWIGYRINYRGVEDGEDAHAEYLRLIGAPK